MMLIELQLFYPKVELLYTQISSYSFGIKNESSLLIKLDLVGTLAKIIIIIK